MLTDEQKKSLSQQQRENMRNERRVGIFGTDQGSGSTSATTGSTSENIRGHADGPIGDDETHGSHHRELENLAQRRGSNRRRFIDNSPGFAENHDQIGRLVQPDKPIGLEATDTPASRPTGKPRKSIPDDIKKALFPKKTVLTEKEATSYQDILPACLQSYGEYIDQYVAWRSGDVALEIWGNLNDTEAVAMTNILLRKGRSNVHVAEFARSVVNAQDYVTVGVMMVPRVMKTVEVLRASPPRRRK